MFNQLLYTNEERLVYFVLLNNKQCKFSLGT